VAVCYPDLPYILISNKRTEDCAQTPSGLLHSSARLVQPVYRSLD
jgi:hypothetical protein